MHNLAVIPARGGSKRVPRKNIRDFLGKPLIAYSIRAAQDSGLFEKIIVSTDDEEIAAVARDYGALTPFMRDKTLADDYTGTESVTADAFRRMSDLGFTAETIACIYATAPLLTGEWLKKAFTVYDKEHADYMYACCEFPFPIQRAQYLDEHFSPTPVMPECMPMRSQDLPKTYQDAGMFYFFSRRRIEKQNVPLVCRGFPMPRYRVIDIDTEEDFAYAQAMARAVTELGFE